MAFKITLLFNNLKSFKVILNGCILHEKMYFKTIVIPTAVNTCCKWLRILTKSYYLKITNETDKLFQTSSARRIYWVDGYYDKIESANFDGNDRMKIFEDFGADLVDIGLGDNYFYFIGWNRPYVYIYICIAYLGTLHICAV